MKQVVKWTAEGAVKCEDHKVFCDVAGRRNLPGICGYPAKRTGHAVNQGGTADKNFYSSLTEIIFLSRTFFYVITIQVSKDLLYNLYWQIAQKKYEKFLFVQWR